MIEKETPPVVVNVQRGSEDMGCIWLVALVLLAGLACKGLSVWESVEDAKHRAPPVGVVEP